MNAKALNLSPMLETKDLQATMHFYTEVLGFNCDTFSEEWGWAHFSKDKIAIMFSRPNEERNIPEPIMSGSLYIEVDDVDSVWDELKYTAKVCYPLENFEYGMREFGVFDNNGYLLQFGEVINKNITVDED
ncbi:VOC family protein [Panacibacter ginsenosidivorans]|nr:VOC family protein [Panacibacter ginsenosidivorans]